MEKPEQPVVPDEPEVRVLEENFFYEEDHVETTLSDSKVSRDSTAFHELFGYDSLKKYNLHLIDDEHMILIAGICYIIYNINTHEVKKYFTKDGGGIGSIAVHPDKNYFAVCEKGDSPNVYIYEYPSLKLYRILRKGTEKSYSNADFSQSGSMLATVGSYPDYLLCVWDWKQEQIQLKTKAFSQEVYRIKFSQYQDDMLCSSGTGHIRFWKIAETFTGLKLKGDIAKFGQVELSDVCAFYAFPDGKVISSTEYGTLLLWEGNFIKCLINLGPNEPIHKQTIEVIFRYKEFLVTAGNDGKIKFLSFNELDQCEGDDDLQYYIKPQKEIHLKTSDDQDAYIVNIQVCDSLWIVQDSNGKIFRLDVEKDFEVSTILSSRVGKINDMALMDRQPGIITVTDDSSINVYDYSNKKEFVSRKFYSTATCISMASQNVAAVGFANGIVRFVQINSDKVRLIKALKVHKDAIKLIKFSPQMNVVCVVSENGDIFFLSFDEVKLDNVTPFCFFETGVKINSLCWSGLQTRVLVGTKSGQIMEIEVPLESACDTTDTYLMEMKCKKYTIKMMESQKPKKDQMSIEFLMKKKNAEEKLDVEWDPEAILNVIYYQQDEKRVLASVDGKFLGYLYVIDLNLERPQTAVQIPKIPHHVLYFSQDILYMGGANGTYQLRHRSDLAKELSVQAHDVDSGRVRFVGLSYDQKALVSAARDGTVHVRTFDSANAIRIFKGELFVEYSQPSIEGQMALDADKQDGEDILDDKIYSIQQAKLLAEQDSRLSLAEKIKNQIRKQIKQLRAEYETIQNENLETGLLTAEMMLIDPDYNQTVEHRVIDEIEETRKELAWDLAYSRLKIKKLKDYVQNELEVDHYLVRALKNPEVFVKTFKLKRMTEFLHNHLQDLNSKLQLEMHQESHLPTQKEEVEVVGQQIQETIFENEVEQEFDTKLKGAKLEREKQKREEEKIKRQLELLEKTRPKETLNKQTEAEIDEAYQKLGIYMLKSSPQYVVPEKDRMNVEKKQGHIFLLEDYIYTTKLRFNQEVSQLKEQKKKIMAKISTYNTRIQTINKDLGIKEELFVPQLDQASEEPESQFEVQESELPQQQPLAQTGEKKEKKETYVTKKTQDFQTYLTVKPRSGLQVRLSPLEQEVQKAKEITLRFEKAKLLKEMEGEVASFDGRIDRCLKEKRTLERDMKVGNMKLVTLYQELLIMAEMEEKDQQMIKKLSDLMMEKQAMEDQQNEIAVNLQQIKENEVRIDRFLVENMKYLKELVYSDDDAKRMKILDYYRQKFRKNKAKSMKQQTEQEENEDEDDEDKEESDEDDYMSDEDEEKLDISPVENDQKTKDIVDKIVELENEQENYRKNKSDLERQKKQIATKASSFSTFLKRTEQELLDFQKEKLQKVNKLDVSYFLKLSQIQNLIPYKELNICPDDLNKSILFTETELQNLTNKIREHENEQKKSKKQHENLKKKKNTLDKQIKENNEIIQDLDSKYKEKHMLKFGDLIDLKILDALEPTKQVLEMRQKFKHEERESIKKVEGAMQSLMSTKKRLLDAKRENTKIINRIQQLGKQQMELNKQLDSTNKNLFKEENEDKKNNLESEKQNLKELVTFLSRQIEDIKTEIGLFKRKGGHIYTMVTTNKK